MKCSAMENLFLRIKKLTSGTAISLVLLSGLVACSSRNGAVTDISTSEESESGVLQEDSSFVLGDGSSDSVPDGLEVTSIDQSSGQGGVDSLPVKNTKVIHSKKSYKIKSNNKSWNQVEYNSSMKEWTVSRGESLSLIAEKVFGNKNSLQKLLALNPQIEDSNVLSVGQVLKLPANEQGAQSDNLAKASSADASQGDLSANSSVKEDSSLTVVSNSPAEGAALSVDASNPAESQPSAEGSMETVPVSSSPVVNVPTVSNTDVESSKMDDSIGASSLVQKVGKVSNKTNLRTLLLMVAVGLLILSGVVFILGRKKA
jgi:hypothetical protein